MSLTVIQKLAGVNRTHVAVKVGVTREHVSQILSGKKEPSLPVAAKIAAEVGVSLDQFHAYWSNLRAA